MGQQAGPAEVHCTASTEATSVVDSNRYLIETSHHFSYLTIKLFVHLKALLLLAFLQLRHHLGVELLV